MSDKRLRALQQAADDVITAWPEVKAKQVFGHRGYVRGRKMFAFLADDGLSVKVEPQERLDTLYAREGVKPFAYGGTMEMAKWPVLPLDSETDLATALSEVRATYETL